MRQSDEEEWGSCWKGPWESFGLGGSMGREVGFDRVGPRSTNNYLFNINQTFPKNLGTQLFLQITRVQSPNLGHLLREVVPLSHTYSHMHAYPRACTQTHTPLKHMHTASPLTNLLPVFTVFRESLLYIVLQTFVFLYFWSVSFSPQDYKLYEDKDSVHFVYSCIIPSPLNTPGT